MSILAHLGLAFDLYAPRIAWMALGAAAAIWLYAVWRFGL